MEKMQKYKLALGLIIMLTGMFSVAFHIFETSISIFLINLGLILFVITSFRLFKQGNLPDRDERTKKLAAYGITYSWLLTLVLIAVLYWTTYFNLIELSTEGVLGILLIFMTISANVFRWYFMQKGDIE